MFLLSQKVFDFSCVSVGKRHKRYILYGFLCDLFWNYFSGSKVLYSYTFDLPGAFLTNFVGSGCLDSVNACLASSPFSRAVILVFCSFNSNSTLKNPAQYSTIDKTEIMDAKEGKLCFWAAISLISTTHSSPVGCLLNSIVQHVIWCQDHESRYG